MVYFAYTPMYSLFEYGEYEQQFDKYLLEAFDRAPSKTKYNLMSFLTGAWGLNELREKYDEHRNIIFNQKPLTKELLEQIKKDRHRVSLGNLKKMPHDQAGFIQEVEAFSIYDKQAKLPALYLCQYLFDDCNSFLNRKKSEVVSLPEAWGRRMHGVDLENTGVWITWIKEELVKPTNWPKIERLLKYVEQREDL